MRRFVIPGDVKAWIADGRFGPRHVRVDEVAAVARAEQVYDHLLCGLNKWVGADGEVTWYVAGRAVTLQWQRRSNRIWRGGRVFLLCPACRQAATRLYVVTHDAPSPACRVCWSLAYPSQLRNYKDNVGVLRGIASSRDFAKRETELQRQSHRQAARERAERRRSRLRLAAL